MKMVLTMLSMAVVLMVSGCARKDDARPNTIASVGSAIDIKEKLAKTRSLQDTHIVVSIENGKTVLSGTVYHKKQKFLASSIARSVRGSGIVVNRIAVR